MLHRTHLDDEREQTRTLYVLRKEGDCEATPTHDYLGSIKPLSGFRRGDHGADHLT